MKISTTHQRFVRILSNQRALEHPEEFLGPNWKDILNFWLYLDTLSSRFISSVDQQTVGLSEPYAIIGGGCRLFCLSGIAKHTRRKCNTRTHMLPQNS